MFRTKILTLACASALAALAPVANADVTLKGQVNRAIMYADDGVDSETFFVDNDNSSTRVILDGNFAMNSDTTVGAQFELEYESSSSASVSMDDNGSDPTASSSFKERKLEVYMKSKSAGELWLGQGDTASNGTSEVDLSGTTLAHYSDLTAFGGNIKFRPNKDANGVVGKGTVDIGNAYDNFDGLSRRDRIRYNTPSLGGLVLSASASNGEALDVAARYKGSFGGVTLDSAIAYADMGDLSDTVKSQFNGSLSVAFDFGLSLTFAAGQRDLEAGNSDPTFYYGKVGYKFGDAAFSVDYGFGDEVGGRDVEGKAIGLGFVYKLKPVSTELFLAGRSFSWDQDGTDYDDIFAVMGGARVKF